MFDGTREIVGASTSDANGNRYMDIIRGNAFDPCPIRIEVDSFDPGTGAVTATATMYSQTATVTGTFHLILIEDDVTGLHTEITRSGDQMPISLTGVGNTEVFSTTLDVSGAVNPANLRVIAFVQQADQVIVQGGSSDQPPLYKARAMVPFSQNFIGPSSGTLTSDDFTVLNVGMAETFDVNLVIDHAPAGWTAQYCDAGNNCFSTPTTLTLSPEESADYYVKVMPSSVGYMLFHLEVSSAQAGTLEVPFAYFTDNIDVLMVDSDGGESYEDYFTAALDAAGLSYGVWDLAKGKPTQEVADTFSTLVWSTGMGYPDAEDLVFLRGFLDQGGALFLTGQDIGWGLARPGSGSDPAFVHDYLHANYIRDDTNLYDLDGVAGDPVSDGIDLHIQGDGGANNQEYPDEIAPRDSDAFELFRYVGDGVGAVRSEDSTSGAKVIYLGFGFEAIDNAADRADLLSAAIGWMQYRVFSDGFESGDTSRWSMTAP